MDQDAGPEVHPMAPEHLPAFITPPGQTDVAWVVVVVFLLLFLLVLGNLYFRLHALPDRMAHRANHGQLQIVGILTLLALFTHNHLFWIAALLLAAVQLPDLMSPLSSIAASLRRLAANDGARDGDGDGARDGSMTRDRAGDA